MAKFNFILSEMDPDGRSLYIPEYHIAIFRGDSKEETVKNIIRIIAKHLAQGDYTLVPEKETLVADHSDTIEKIVTECNAHTIFVDDSFIQIAPAPDQLPEGVKEVTADAYDSPFLQASPFIVKGKDLYAVDSETGTESGPFRGADNDGGYFLVYNDRKGGVISPKGSVIADCIYDSAYNDMGYAILEKDGKLGFYSPFACVLIPCEYDDLRTSDDPDMAIIAVKDGVDGHIYTDGTFHPLDDEDCDLTPSYL